MKSLFVAVATILIISENFLSTKQAEDGAKIRQKRSFICKYKLTSVLKDAIIAALEDYKKSDPLEIGDAEGGNLKDGYIKGLSTLRNLTELDVYCLENKLLIVTSAVELKNIEIFYNWVYEMWCEFDGTIGVTIREIHIEYEIHLHTTTMEFEVVRLTVSRLNGFGVGFTGLGLLNPVVRGTMKTLYIFQQGETREKIETYIRQEIEKKLSKIPSTLSFVSLLDIFI